jgi:hypothetical protein
VAYAVETAQHRFDSGNLEMPSKRIATSRLALPA